MKEPQLSMIGISGMCTYTIPNYNVKGRNKFGDGSITSEQIKKVYADIAEKIAEIERVHPTVCMEVRTGITGEENSKVSIVMFRAYRYMEEGKDIPDYMHVITPGNMFGTYECKKEGHSPGFECGPWMGSFSDIWDIMVETGDEAAKRKESLEKVCISFSALS